jgi:alanine dehydrogenase
MKATMIVLASTLLLGSAWCGLGQTKVWTGGGDGVSWTNAANWSGGTVPAGSYDVMITNGLGTSVVLSSGNITVRSITCTKAFTLSGGALMVTGGASQFGGPFTITGGAELTANGPGTSLTVSGATVASNGNFYALYGGSLHFPNLGSATNNAYTTYWHAEGAGSLVDVSAITNLAVGNNSRLYLEAFTGGTVDMRRLVTMTNTLWVNAQDAGSVVNLSGLAGRYRCYGNYELKLEARDGGSILVPNLTQLERATVTLVNTGMVSTAQLNLLTNVDLTVDGAAPDFGRITNIDDTSVKALNGAIARLTNVTRGVMNAYTTAWHAEGAESQVDVSAITNLAVGNNSRLYLEAYSGGTVDLHRLTTTTNTLWVDAQDAGSLVDLRGLLGRYRAYGNYELKLETRDGATVLAPNITQLERATVSIINDGTMPTAQWNLLTNVDLTVNGAAPDFSAVTNIDDTSVKALNGGIARLTSVARGTMNAYTTAWHAEGAGSLVDVSRITSLAVGNNSRLYLEAYNGGTIDLHRLTTMTNTLWVDAQDLGSTVDLSGLSGRYRAYGNYELKLEARDGATVLVPNITQLERATLTLVNTGMVSTAQLNLLTNVDLTVNGTAPDFGRITNIDDTSITALNGGLARLTNVTRGIMNAYTVAWHAEGAESLVDVSAITNLAVGNNSRLYLEAYQGGTVDLHRLTIMTNTLWVDAQDVGSVVNLSGLSGRYHSHGNYALKLEARDGASVLVPHVTQLERATLSLINTGMVSTAQLNLLTNVTVTVDAAAPAFGGITNVDDSSVFARNGGLARLTNVTRALMNTYTATWQAEGAGSLVDLSRLTNLVVGYNSRLYVYAYSGGKVDLQRLASLSTGAIQTLADGVNSVIDLLGVNGFITVGNYPSSLTARNSGEILFNDQAFLLANVGITIPAGNAILPATLIASPTLTLYGRPWHSYWIEKRDTRLTENPWVFAARVPLVNPFQAFAAAPPPNTEFRVWDFVAYPPIVDLFPAADHQVQLVYYGRPDATHQVFSATNLMPGVTWEPGTTISMTNAFRILAPMPAPERWRFFRGKQL